MAERFELHRIEDVSGVSGVGVVAEGVRFKDGTCAYRWLSGTATTNIADSIADIEAIHGHGGATRIAWVDAPGKCLHTECACAYPEDAPEHCGCDECCCCGFNASAG